MYGGVVTLACGMFVSAPTVRRSFPDIPPPVIVSE
jgi:hypothetical protein